MDYLKKAQKKLYSSKLNSLDKNLNNFFMFKKLDAKVSREEEQER